LSSGTARLPELLSAGVPVGLAVDGSASQDGSNLLEEVRVAYLLHRLKWSRLAPSGYDILKLAPRGSARILGREDIGQIATGKCADLFLIDSRRLELTGALFDPKNVLGTVGFRQPVDYTMVNGLFTVRKGRLCSIDEQKLADEAEKVCRAYLRKGQQV
ncbi:MAG: amidohydrolase family protein, partial [Clostridia bacterium]|nr:amidohydrolase family protein [Clostridia bacterium]